jgi:hypothetical protein
MFDPGLSHVPTEVSGKPRRAHVIQRRNAEPDCQSVTELTRYRPSPQSNVA